MTIARMTLTCRSCQMSFRMERVLNRKPTVIGPPAYCLWCGEATLACAVDSDLDTDEVLAESYDLSVTQFRKVYELWILIAHDKPFARFVAEVKSAQQAKLAKSTQP